MTILAAGVCMIIAATTQTNWKSPHVMSPLLALGRRSYEVYLTHMFVVFGLFQVFTLGGKSMSAVIPLFIVVIVIAGFLGEAVARLYSEPMNHLIRERWRETANEVHTFAEPNERIGRAVQQPD
jgi:peptidoglycan/LPS O-acetylase OafA/YrhL